MAPLAHAVSLADRNIPVFPMIAVDKRPACKHGVKDATCDAETIRGWFGRRRGIIPAIATGAPSSITVLDIDRQHGGGGWWSENREALPNTFTYRTRSGGLHLWFQHHPEARTRPNVGPGVEIRSTGASAIYWPAAGLPILMDVDVAPLPIWLLPPPKAAWTPPAAEPWRGDDRKARRYAEGALRHAIERVASATTGTRNATLNAETFGLMRFVGEGSLTASEVAEAMAHAGLAAGLDRREIEGTLRSALSARRPT